MDTINTQIVSTFPMILLHKILYLPLKVYKDYFSQVIDKVSARLSFSREIPIQAMDSYYSVKCTVYFNHQFLQISA